MTAQVILAILIGIAASAEDLWHRSVSNWIPVCALFGGFAWHVSQKGWTGLGTAAAGGAAGFGIFLIFYLLGGMGGGDIKLMAGFGALIGAGRLVEAALWTAILGALLAVAVIGVNALRGIGKKDRKKSPLSIPYAPAISAGVWLSLVPR
ncbi:MAG TPA: A24 family peptidase [Bryobacteraceae bacterium]|nr:A24 family peptidase [Bryobacteraceae bacterium]